VTKRREGSHPPHPPRQGPARSAVISGDRLVGEGGLVENLDPEPVGIEAIEGAAAIPVVARLGGEGDATLPEASREPIDLFPRVDDEPHVAEGSRTRDFG